MMWVQKRDQQGIVETCALRCNFYSGASQAEKMRALRHPPAVKLQLRGNRAAESLAFIFFFPACLSWTTALHVPLRAGSRLDVFVSLIIICLMFVSPMRL